MSTKKFFDNSYVFIIAEAGSNWKCGSFKEDLDRAKKLIDIAASSGADAVKFQTYKAETIVSSNAGMLPDQDSTEYSTINEMFDYLSMPYQMIPKLSDYCNQKNILFMSTPFSVEDAKEIDPFVDIHKIASFEINHVRLLEFLAQTGKPIILSTGTSTYEEIDFALDILNKNGNKNLSLLQCTSNYPAVIESLNLSVIPEMKKRYNCKVGFSDHSLDPVIGPVTSVGFGSTIIEKHFTLDKNLKGPDHSFALNPNELKLMIDSVRLAQSSKGIGQKVVHDDEQELKKIGTRSIQAIKDILKGDKLVEGKNFEILRPGFRKRGKDAKFLNQVNGKTSTVDVKKGDGIILYE
jgi:N,N'-diacetyllegionaminate synthase